jgi:hypothetical protein
MMDINKSNTSSRVEIKEKLLQVEHKESIVEFLLTNLKKEGDVYRFNLPL